MTDRKQPSGKVPFDILPLQALKGVCRVLEYGATVRYERGNWHTADDDDIGNRYIGAMLRHIADAQRPDGSYDMMSLCKLDVDSGLPEIDHALTGLIILRGLMIKRGALPADPKVAPPSTEVEVEQIAKATRVVWSEDDEIKIPTYRIKTPLLMNLPDWENAAWFTSDADAVAYLRRVELGDEVFVPVPFREGHHTIAVVAMF